LKTVLKQLLLAALAAIFAANGLLHPLFHASEHSGAGGGAAYYSSPADRHHHAPEVVPDFCPVCAGFFAFALTPEKFSFSTPPAAKAGCPAYFPPISAFQPVAASARAPPSA